MANQDYTRYALIREDNNNIYNEKEIKIKMTGAKTEQLSIAEAMSFFTGISLPLLEKAIDQFGPNELSKHIYCLDITAAKRKKLELLLTLYQDIYSVRATKMLNVNTPNKIADYLYSKIGLSQNENFYVLYLNAKCDVIGTELLFIGGCNQCTVDIPLLFKKAIVNGATNIIIAHNHPSGSPNPSLEDNNITKAIRTAGDMLKVNLLDHVIVGSYQSYYSYKENGLI